MSSKDIFRVLRKEKLIVMACNARISHSIPGLMRAAKAMDAVIGFELAKSESNLKGGYTGFTPKLFFETIIDYAQKENFDLPFFIHADHTTVKDTSREAIEEARELNESNFEWMTPRSALMLPSILSLITFASQAN